MDDKLAAEKILEEWNAWRRAKEKEGTQLRKSLGLCIGLSCKNLPAPNKTRCYKHSVINRSAAAKFSEKKLIQEFDKPMGDEKNPARTEVIQALKKHYGTFAATAKAIGVDSKTVRRWLKNGVPDNSPLWSERQLSIDESFILAQANTREKEGRG